MPIYKLCTAFSGVNSVEPCTERKRGSQKGRQAGRQAGATSGKNFSALHRLLPLFLLFLSDWADPSFLPTEILLGIPPKKWCLLSWIWEKGEKCILVLELTEPWTTYFWAYYVAGFSRRSFIISSHSFQAKADPSTPSFPLLSSTFILLHSVATLSQIPRHSQATKATCHRWRTVAGWRIVMWLVKWITTVRIKIRRWDEFKMTRTIIDWLHIWKQN